VARILVGKEFYLLDLSFNEILVVSDGAIQRYYKDFDYRFSLD